MSEIDLKPCPFCGARLVEAETFATRHTKTFVHPPIETDDGDVWCPGSHVHIETSKEDRVAAWNRRDHQASLAAVTADRDRMVEALTAVRTAIVEADPNILTCTLWMPDHLAPSETVVDFIDAALTNTEDRT